MPEDSSTSAFVIYVCGIFFVATFPDPFLDVLNRFPNKPSKPQAEEVGNVEENNDDNVIRVMMYMFPRQFGLHNVFTSTVDRQQTAQKFQDYTLREEEISKKFPRKDGKALAIHVPKRLRGMPKDLVRKLQI